MAELETCKAEGHNYNVGLYHIEAAYEGIRKRLKVVHKGNRKLEGETRDLLVFAKSQGFQQRPTTLLHPQGNGLVGRFIGVLVKTIPTAQADRTDPKQVIKRWFFIFRNTSHPSTGVATLS